MNAPPYLGTMDARHGFFILVPADLTWRRWKHVLNIHVSVPYLFLTLDQFSFSG